MQKQEEKAVNADCVGPTSESAGKALSCAGCPNQSACADGSLQAAALAENQVPHQIALRMASFGAKLVVLSGKGGVGKSTFASQLALFLASDNNNNDDDVVDDDDDDEKNIGKNKKKKSEKNEVGLLDVDICGPSIPKILGLEGEELHQSNSGWSPVYFEDNLAVISVGFMLPNPDDAIIWRGPKKNGLIKQFLLDVDWGRLDYLVIDTPPGTSDEHLSVITYLKETGIDGAVIVTTPQEVSLVDVRKEITFCKKTGIKVLGVVENMSGFVCPKCSKSSDIFPPDTGGAQKMAEEMSVPFLGKIPLDPNLARCCDQGLSFLEEYGKLNPPSVIAFRSVISNLLKNISQS